MWCEKINRIPVASFATSIQATRTIDQTVRRDEDNSLFPSDSTTSSLRSEYIFIPLNKHFMLGIEINIGHIARLRTIKHQSKHIRNHHVHLHRRENRDAMLANTSFLFVFIYFFAALRYYAINEASHICTYTADSGAGTYIVLIFILTQPNDLINYSCAARQTHFHSLIQINEIVDLLPPWRSSSIGISNRSIALVRNQTEWDGWK